MDKKTLEALKKSIIKWERILSFNGFDYGSTDCALCINFRAGFSCDGCPIANKTGEDLCWGTAYEKWTIHQEDVHNNFRAKNRIKGCRTCYSLARRELTFLISLLPKEKRS